MNPGWSCFQCEAPNPLTARHCSSCGAQRPPMPLADDEVPETPPRPETPPSDMLIGLMRLVRQAATGEMAPADFAARMQAAGAGLDEVFAGMAAELYEIPQGDEGYVDGLEAALHDVGSLFRLALAELAAFGPAGDPGRLRVGMWVAEKAEEQYQALLASVQADAAGHALGGHRDEVRRLAAAVAEGALSLEDYRARLAETGEAVAGWLQSGGEAARAGLAAALEFDGLRAEPLERSAALLEQASRDLGRVILAFHAPEATREAARKILAES